MTIIQSLFSWISYALAGAVTSERGAATVAAVAAVAVIVRLRSCGRDNAELTIEWSSALFFVGYAIVSWFAGDVDRLSHWIGPVSQLWLAGSVAAGLVRHRPFTLPLARREAPVEIHATPWFYDFNVKLTRAWLASFTLSGMVLLAAATTGHSPEWLNVICIAAAILAPTLYTRALVQKAGPPHHS